jgi:hypothetical protein
VSSFAVSGVEVEVKFEATGAAIDELSALSDAAVLQDTHPDDVVPVGDELAHPAKKRQLANKNHFFMSFSFLDLRGT